MFLFFILAHSNYRPNEFSNATDVIYKLDHHSRPNKVVGPQHYTVNDLGTVLATATGLGCYHIL